MATAGEMQTTDDPSFAEVWDALQSGQRASKGIYSVYKTPDAGLHIAFRPDGTEEDQHLEIPAAMMKMLIAASEGKGPLGMLRGMMR